MIAFRSTFARAAAATLAVLGTVAAEADTAQAQARRGASGPSTPPAAARQTPRAGEPSQAASRTLRVRSEALAKGRYAVVIDLDANRLHFAKGRRVLWSAPVGTGTGLRLENGRNNWDFATPNGTFHVTYKEREPDWIAPDWYFVENNLPIPGPDDVKRRFPRGLGSAAVFIGRGLAIHGTDKPELLGQRVSHGCIRLANHDALRLFHNVQVGTEIVITGGRNPAPAAAPATPARTSASSRARTNSRGERVPPPRDPYVVELEAEPTEALLDRLEEGLVGTAFAGSEGKWPLVASVLVLRGAKGDDDAALAGLFARADAIGGGALRDEYATFLADAFAQGPLRTLEVMGRMDRDGRALVARSIVEASLALYPGELEDTGAPWPTRRAPRDVLDRYGRRGWDALQEAEQEVRDARGIGGRRADVER